MTSSSGHRLAAVSEFVWSVADGVVGGGGGERPSAAAKEWSAFVRSHLEGMYYK